MSIREWIDTDLNWRRTIIWGSAESITNLIERIDLALPTDWSRNLKAEENYKLRGGEAPSALCYVRRVGAGEVWLWMNRPSPKRLIGANVIPTQNLGDYRRHAAEAIAEFRTRILEPLLTNSGVVVEENRTGPYDTVTADVMEHLWELADRPERTFPLTGTATDVWRDLIIEGRKSNVAIDPDNLKHWFERRGWQPRDARHLADRFFEDVWLLSAYDEARQPA